MSEPIEPAPAGPPTTRDPASNPSAADPTDEPVGIPVAARRDRRRLFVGGAVGVVVVALLVGLIGIPVYRRIFATPADRVLTALHGLAVAPSVRYTGGLTPDAQDDLSLVHLDLWIAADGGGTGSMSRTGGRARLLITGGHDYVRADSGWQLATDAVDAGYRTGHWVRSTEADMDVATPALRPAVLAATLGAGLHARDRDSRHGAVARRAHRLRSWRGAAVVPYSVPSGAVVYVTADAPYRLVGVDGSLGATPSGYLSLGVTVGDHADGAALSRDVAAAARGLAADRDPVGPPEFDVVEGSAELDSCDGSACTGSVRVEIRQGTRTGGAGYLLGVFGAEPGAVVDGCVVDLPAIRPGRPVRVGCTLRSTRLREWTHESGPPDTFAAMPVASDARGSGPQLLTTLTHHPEILGLLADPSAPQITEPPQSVELLFRLVNEGWRVDAAVDEVDDVVAGGVVGPVLSMVRARAITLPYKPYDATFDATVPAYVEAGRRVAAGSTRVAVGPWSHASTSYRADVFDLTQRRAVSLAPVDAVSPTSLGSELRAVVRTVRAQPVPVGFSRELRVVLGPRSGLYRMGRADLLAELRAGLSSGGLRGIGSLVLVAGTGTYSFGATDLG